MQLEHFLELPNSRNIFLHISINIVQLLPSHSIPFFERTFCLGKFVSYKFGFVAKLSDSFFRLR